MSRYFIDPKALPGKVIAPGTEIRVAYGDKIMFSFVEIKPGGVVPMHNHPHEQGGMLLKGKLKPLPHMSHGAKELRQVMARIRKLEGAK
jgi:hypothetical protein